MLVVHNQTLPSEMEQLLFTIVLVLVGDVNSAWASETISFILAKYRYWYKLRYFDSPCEGSNILVGKVARWVSSFSNYGGALVNLL